MRSVVVLLAASLLGADRPKGPETPLISYEMKILDMDGLGWRSSLHAQLAPVARQGSATVWTGSRETASKLAEKAARVVAAPRLTSEPQVRSTVFKNSVRKIVAEVIREADGPVNHASFVGYVPRVEDATEGYSAQITGRSLDQGVLASLTLEDRQITALHAVPLTEVLESKPGQDGEKTPVKVSVQIPEYARGAVSGEWLIPKDGVLVVSLGVHTGADPKGQAVARERLVVIAAEATAGEPGTLTAGPVNMKMNMNVSELRNVTFARPAVSTPRLATPVLPGRSLPLARNASGQPVPLPPLPEFEAPVTQLPGTSEACASPQAATPLVAGEPVPFKKSELRDTQTNRAGFSVDPPRVNEAAKAPVPFQALPHYPPYEARKAEEVISADSRGKVPPCCDEEAECVEAESPVAKGASATKGKGLKFSIPLSERLKIEVDAKLAPFDPSRIGERY